MSRKVLAAVFWAVMVIAPLAFTAVTLAGLPVGTEQMPMQVGFDGHVNRWGAPRELWLLGGIMAGCNLLLALCYRFNDALFAMGLVHGVKTKRGARIGYAAVALFLVVTTAWALWFLVSKI